MQAANHTTSPHHMFHRMKEIRNAAIQDLIPIAPTLKHLDKLNEEDSRLKRDFDKVDAAIKFDLLYEDVGKHIAALQQLEIKEAALEVVKYIMELRKAKKDLNKLNYILDSVSSVLDTVDNPALYDIGLSDKISTQVSTYIQQADSETETSTWGKIGATMSWLGLATAFLSGVGTPFAIALAVPMVVPYVLLAVSMLSLAVSLAGSLIYSKDKEAAEEAKKNGPSLNSKFSFFMHKVHDNHEERAQARQDEQRRPGVGVIC